MYFEVQIFGAALDGAALELRVRTHAQSEEHALARVLKRAFSSNARLDGGRIVAVRRNRPVTALTGCVLTAIKEVKKVEKAARPAAVLDESGNVVAGMTTRQPNGWDFEREGQMYRLSRKKTALKAALAAAEWLE
jgi:hypothetical protein